MKVVKYGPPFQKEWKAEVTCSQCRTVFELEKRDVERRWQEGDRPWESPGYLYFWTCVLCKKVNYLSDGPRDSLLIANPELRER